jgi:hypothetical protein
MHIKALDRSFNWAVKDLLFELEGFVNSPRIERGYYLQDELNRIRLTFQKAQIGESINCDTFAMLPYMNFGNKILEDVRQMYFNARNYVLENGSLDPAMFDNITGASTTLTINDLLIMDGDGIRESIQRFIHNGQKVSFLEESNILKDIDKSRLSNSAKQFFISMIEETCEIFRKDEKMLKKYLDIINDSGITLVNLTEEQQTYAKYCEYRTMRGYLLIHSRKLGVSVGQEL